MKQNLIENRSKTYLHALKRSPEIWRLLNEYGNNDVVKGYYNLRAKLDCISYSLNYILHHLKDDNNTMIKQLIEDFKELSLQHCNIDRTLAGARNTINRAATNISFRKLTKQKIKVYDILINKYMSKAEEYFDN